uniref:Uncharacterized protein n=1 Tax=Electrophorus electricus TaxID=8005 RepID=A0A4W4H8S0_ELEEL
NGELVEHRDSFDPEANLTHLDAFIYETMHYSSFVLITIPHSNTQDLTIEGFLIPKYIVLIINQWSVSHNHKKWHDPHNFNPSRFLDNSGALDKELTKIIFSVGKRRCSGDQIAKVEVFLIAVILLHQLTFESDSSQELSINCLYGLTLKTLNYNNTFQTFEDAIQNQSTFKFSIVMYILEFHCID